MKTALITGSARGIGRACALRLARDGWRLALHYHKSAEAAAALRDELRAHGCDAEIFPADVALRVRRIAAAHPALNITVVTNIEAARVADRVAVGSDKADDRTEFTPAVVMSYKPFKRADFNLRGFYKKIFRMPTLNDLYYTFIGNVSLRPEYTTQYDIGFTYAAAPRRSWLKRVEVQADAYYNNVKDKIIAIPTSNQFRWTMVNLGRVDILGVDVSASATLEFPCDLRLDGRLSYTYQQAEDVTSRADSYYGDQIPYIPWHSGSAIVNVSWRGFELDENIPQNYVPEWYTSDIALSYNFRISKTKMRLTAEVNNVFNQQFEVVKCYPMPGTNYKVTLKVEI